MENDQPTLCSATTGSLDPETRAEIIRLCVSAHDEPDFENLFSYLPPEGVHVTARLGDDLVGHAVVNTRWLQQADEPLMRTGYVDAVSTAPQFQGRGIGTAVMHRVAEVLAQWDIGCLETEGSHFYRRLGWEEWSGPLAGRTDEALIPTPDQTGIMVLRLEHTPPLDLAARLSIEANEFRIW